MINKFRLAVDDFQITGYNLISPLLGDNPTKLNEHIDNGEANEIILENILEYIPVEQTLEFLKLLVSKLKKGGTTTIVSNDITILSEMFIRGEINIIDFNKILFGEKNHAWNFKLSIVTLGDINDILKSLGAKILERRIDGYKFIIKVEKQ